jgi:polar amino acid transport system substrate-binding protein
MKKMGYWILACMLILSVSLTGCGPSGGGGNASGGDAGGGSSSDAASLTLTTGVLKVGMEVGYPPMEYLEEDGVTVTGFDYEVAQEIAKKMGVEVEVVDTAWDGIFSSLDSNRYDCIISSVSITPSRQEAYNLTRPYIANAIVIVAKNDAQIGSPQDLAGLRVATQTETTADEYMRELRENGLAVADEDYFVYDKIIQCFDELRVNRVDAVMVDSVVAAYYMGSDSDKFKVVWENDEAEPLGICLKKGNDALTAEIERIVDELYDEGIMTRLAEKYFGRDVTQGVR